MVQIDVDAKELHGLLDVVPLGLVLAGDGACVAEPEEADHDLPGHLHAEADQVPLGALPAPTATAGLMHQVMVGGG